MRIVFIYRGGNLDHFGIDMFPKFSPAECNKRGLGGTEASIVRLTEELARRGHDVTVFAPLLVDHEWAGVEWIRIERIFPLRADLLVYCRTPSTSIKYDKLFTAEVKLLWLYDWTIETSDLLTAVNSRVIDALVVNSRAHRDEVCRVAGLTPDLVHEISAGFYHRPYSLRAKKTPARCIYCTSPGRGLEHLLEMWPKILKEVPSAQLFVTSTYRLWGLPQKVRRSFSIKYRQAANRLKQVTYLGGLERQELVELQSTSELFLYPCTFHETCCIAALECIASGAVLVTRPIGALAERVESGHTGYLIDDHPQSRQFRDQFVESAIHLLRQKALTERMMIRAQSLLVGHTFPEIATSIESLYTSIGRRRPAKI